MPGIPCVYYGTEQGLHGAGSDPAVREALWGLVPGFPTNSTFYTQLQALANVIRVTVQPLELQILQH
jgi:glycosidase